MATYAISDVQTLLRKIDNTHEHFVGQINETATSADLDGVFTTGSGEITLRDSTTNAEITGITISVDVSADLKTLSIFVVFGATALTGSYYVRAIESDATVWNFNANSEIITMNTTFAMTFTQPAITNTHSDNIYTYAGQTVSEGGNVYVYPGATNVASGLKYRVGTLVGTTLLGVDHTFEVVVAEADDATADKVTATFVSGTTWTINIASDTPLQNNVPRPVTLHLIDKTAQRSINLSFTLYVAATPLWTLSQTATANQLVYNNRFYFEKQSLGDTNGRRLISGAFTGGANAVGTLSTTLDANHELAQVSTAATISVKNTSANALDVTAGEENLPTTMDATSVTYTEYSHVFSFSDITGGALSTASYTQTGVYQTMVAVAAASGLTLTSTPSNYTLQNAASALLRLPGTGSDLFTVVTRYGIGTYTPVISGDLATAWCFDDAGDGNSNDAVDTDDSANGNNRKFVYTFTNNATAALSAGAKSVSVTVTDSNSTEATNAATLTLYDNFVETATAATDAFVRVDGGTPIAAGATIFDLANFVSGGSGSNTYTYTFNGSTATNTSTSTIGNPTSPAGYVRTRQQITALTITDSLGNVWTTSGFTSKAASASVYAYWYADITMAITAPANQHDDGSYIISSGDNVVFTMTGGVYHFTVPSPSMATSVLIHNTGGSTHAEFQGSVSTVTTFAASTNVAISLISSQDPLVSNKVVMKVQMAQQTIDATFNGGTAVSNVGGGSFSFTAVAEEQEVELDEQFNWTMGAVTKTLAATATATQHTLNNTTGIFKNMRVTGTGITGGTTYVASVNSSTLVTLSASVSLTNGNSLLFDLEGKQLIQTNTGQIAGQVNLENPDTDANSLVANLSVLTAADSIPNNSEVFIMRGHYGVDVNALIPTTTANLWANRGTLAAAAVTDLSYTGSITPSGGVISVANYDTALTVTISMSKTAANIKVDNIFNNGSSARYTLIAIHDNPVGRQHRSQLITLNFTATNVAWAFDGDTDTRANLQSIAGETQHVVGTPTTPYNIMDGISLNTNDEANVYNMKLYVANMTAAASLAASMSVAEFNALESTSTIPTNLISVSDDGGTTSTYRGDAGDNGVILINANTDAIVDVDIRAVASTTNLEAEANATYNDDDGVHFSLVLVFNDTLAGGITKKAVDVLVNKKAVVLSSSTLTTTQTVNGQVASGTAIVLDSVTGLAVNDHVAGTNIAAGAYITDITSLTITLSAAVEGTVADAATLTFTEQYTNEAQAGYVSQHSTSPYTLLNALPLGLDAATNVFPSKTMLIAGSSVSAVTYANAAHYTTGFTGSIVSTAAAATATFTAAVNQTGLTDTSDFVAARGSAFLLVVVNDNRLFGEEFITRTVAINTSPPDFSAFGAGGSVLDSTKVYGNLTDIGDGTLVIDESTNPFKIFSDLQLGQSSFYITHFFIIDGALAGSPSYTQAAIEAGTGVSNNVLLKNPANATVDYISIAADTTTATAVDADILSTYVAPSLADQTFTLVAREQNLMVGSRYKSVVLKVVYDTRAPSWSLLTTYPTATKILVNAIEAGQDADVAKQVEEDATDGRTIFTQVGNTVSSDWESKLVLLRATDTVPSYASAASVSEMRVDGVDGGIKTFAAQDASGTLTFDVAIGSTTLSADDFDGLSASPSATATSAGTTVTMNSTAAVDVGMTLFLEGVTTGETVASITDSTTLEMTGAVSVTNGDVLSFESTAHVNFRFYVLEENKLFPTRTASTTLYVNMRVNLLGQIQSFALAVDNALSIIGSNAYDLGSIVSRDGVAPTTYRFQLQGRKEGSGDTYAILKTNMDGSTVLTGANAMDDETLVTSATAGRIIGAVTAAQLKTNALTDMPDQFTMTDSIGQSTNYWEYRLFLKAVRGSVGEVIDDFAELVFNARTTHPAGQFRRYDALANGTSVWQTSTSNDNSKLSTSKQTAWAVVDTGLGIPYSFPPIQNIT